MSDSSNKKKRSGIAAVFWIVLALIILIAFLIKQDDIVRVLKETEFFIHVFGEEPDFIANYESQVEQDTGESTIILTEEDLLTTTRDISTDENQSIILSDKLIDDEEELDIVEPSVTPTDNSATTEATSSTNKATEEKTIPPPVVEQPTVKMNQSLYFILINGDGTIERKEVVREVPKNTTPLTAALKALLNGPGLPERESGYISLIPEGTKLLSAKIQNKSATIDFSEEFAFNQYGVEGYLGQLMQIVYTATSFATIESVQFLIDGQKSEYLGGEGVWIGTPLSRTNFK